MTRVAIIQPYLPAYRVPLFDAVEKILSDQGISLEVITGRANSVQVLRGDSTTGRPWQTLVDTRDLSVAGHWLRYYGVGTPDADAVVLELAAGCLNTYRALSGHRTPIGLWGHVGAPADGGGLDARLVRWQAKRAQRIFAYTEAGGRQAQQYGVVAERITVIGNSLETDGLEADLRAADGNAVAAFRVEAGLGDGPVVCFIGGLDESKRVDVLRAAADAWWQAMPELKIVVCGEGAEKGLLADAHARGQLLFLGYVSGRTKAMAMAVADCLVCPGRVGLLAVESLVAGTPIVTMASSAHAPEYDYLVPGVSCFATADDSAEAYAEAVLHLLRSPATLAQLRQGCQSAVRPTLARAAANFSDGIVRLIEGV